MAIFSVAIKKLVAFSLALLLCVLILPAAGVFADDSAQSRSVEIDGFKFSLQYNKAKLLSYKGSKTDVVIPDSVEGCPVTAIHTNAFDSHRGITSVVIPDSVSSLDSRAFRDCISLTSVVLSKSLTEIKMETFCGCSTLKTVTIHASVQKIGSLAFAGCSELESVVIEDGVKLIDYGAFQNCTKLKSVTVPGSVKTIGADAFAESLAMTSVTLDEGVETLGDGAFRGYALKSFYLPKSVKSIGSNIILNCTNLDKLNYAGTRADWDKISIDPDNEDLFAVEIVFSDGTTQNAGETNPVAPLPSFTGKTDLLSYSADKGEVTITGFIADQSDLDKDYVVVIPSQINGYPVKTIAKNAFAVHPRIKIVSVTIEDGVEAIGNCAFYGCRYLTSVSIPKSVTSIGKSVFADCGSVKTFTLDPQNPSYTFTGGCLIEKSTKTLLFGLKNAVIPSDGSVKTIADQAFQYNTGLAKLTVPSGVTAIGWEAFLGCPIVSVELPEGLVSIGERAFGGCEKLKKIVIPDSVKTIGDGAFSCNYALKSVKLPAGLERIGEAQFSKCKSLTSVEIPSGVTQIGAEAFYKCEALAEIKLPAGIKTISEGAFLSCGKLAKVWFAGSEEEWMSVSIGSENSPLLNAKIFFNSAYETQPVASSAPASTAKQPNAPASTAKKTEALASTKAQESTVPATASVTEAPASFAEPTEEAAQSTVPTLEAAQSSAPVSEQTAQISADPALASAQANIAQTATHSASSSVPQSSDRPDQQNDPTVWIVVGVVAVAGAAMVIIVRIIRKNRKA